MESLLRSVSAHVDIYRHKGFRREPSCTYSSLTLAFRHVSRSKRKKENAKKGKRESSHRREKDIVIHQLCYNLHKYGSEERGEKEGEGGFDRSNEH